MSVKVTYVSSSGTPRTLEVEPGVSVMQAGMRNGLAEIESDCGGACSCASCHVYVDADWLDKFPPMTKIENALLSMLDVRGPNSRLSCQLKVTEDLDGLTVHTLDPVANE